MTDLALNTRALDVRTNTNRTLGSNDFVGWVLSLLRPQAGERVLDVACGTGNLAIPIARALGPHGALVGADASEQALTKLTKNAQESGLGIETRVLRMEDIRGANIGVFDAALCAYALYYAGSAADVIQSILDRLTRDGRLLIVVPDAGNNQEMIDLLRLPVPPPDYRAAYVTICEQWFDNVTTASFNNPIVFPTADSLLRYWAASSYRAGSNRVVEQLVRSHFAAHPSFTNYKRVLAILATRGGT